MNKLSGRFTAERYQLSVRLVNEEDAGYILKLRTDTGLAKFIHQTDNDLDKHLKWMKQYKERELDGRDYYFIYFKDGQPVGVNRIYNIYHYYATIGSWICDPTNDAETSIATYFFMLDILFEYMNLDLTIFDVRKKNTHVWKLHKMAGAIKVGESDVDYYFAINKQTYLSQRESLLSISNIK